jgi:hypothetical protein
MRTVEESIFEVFCDGDFVGFYMADDAAEAIANAQADYPDMECYEWSAS